MPGSPRALISKLLVAALGGTGAISLVVWLAPGLVMLGLFLLILPGLFLGAMPTLFFYLVVFAVVWFALQAQPPLIAAFTGLSAVVTVAVGVPAFLNSQTELRLIEAAQRDRSPAFPIRPPVATIALDYEGRSSTSCDEVCQLLLYHHAASRVVVLNSKTPTAYQISSPCATAQADLRMLRDGVEWSDFAHREAVSKGVRMRIAGDECLDQEKHASGAPDLTIRWLDEPLGRNGLRHVTVRGVEVQSGSRVLARETVREAHFFSTPLYLRPYGSGLEFVGWEWAWHAPAPRPVKRLEMLKHLTGFALDPPATFEADRIRQKLDATLDRPASSGAGFALAADYYELLRQDGFEAGDTQRLVRMLEDERLLDFSFLSSLPFKKEGMKPILRDAALRRLDRLSTAGDRNNAGRLEAQLMSLPEGAFRDPAPALEALLSKPALRRFYAGLIPRLADQGPAGAEPLTAIIEDAWSRPDVGFAWGRDAEAATLGLCRLGQAAQPMLPRLLAADERFQGVNYTHGHAWRAMLIALGADAERFSHVNYKKNLTRYRDDLRRQAKSCGVKR